MLNTGDENDLVKAVDNLLNDLGPKFSKVSAEMFAKSIGDYHHLNLDIRLIDNVVRSGRDVSAT